MKTINKIQFLVISAVILMSGCKQDDIFVTLDNSDDNRDFAFAGPFANVSFIMRDFIDDIDDELIYVHEDGLLSIRYREELFLDWDDLVVLEDFSDTWSYSSLKSSGLKSIGTIEQTERIKLNHRPEVRYDRIVMHSGLLNMHLEVPPGSEGDITITIPEIVEDDEPLSFHFQVTEFNRVFSVTDYSLANKEVILKQDPDEETEEEFSYITVVTAIDLETVMPGSVTDDLSFMFSLTNMQHEIIFGYFGIRDSEFSNATISMGFFEELDFDEDELEFGGFMLDVEVHNPLGVPFSVKADNIRFFKEEDAEPDQPDWFLLDNEDNIMEVYLNVQSAEYGPPVIPTTSNLGEYVIDQESSNIVEIINKYPLKLQADISGKSNYYHHPDHPDYDETAPKSNFMGMVDQLQADLVVDVPLWFRTQMYTRQDTIEFDFNDMIKGDEDDVRKLKDLALYMNFLNTIPIDIIVSAKVIDGSGNHISDLLKGDSFISSGELVDGRVITPKETEFIVSITGEHIDDFIEKGAMEIVIETQISTANEGNELIKIFDDSGLSAVISLDLEGQIP